jgi:dephospho-CoA kinase
MLSLKKIAITGGLSTGKSTVCGLLKEMGAYVLNADEIVHDLIDNRKDIQKKIIDLLGPDIEEKGKVDRKKIAEKVFKDPLLLSHLEKILHPEVRIEIQKKSHEISKQHHYSAFVVEIPLLFETEPYQLFDATITVHADEALCYKRFQAKTGKNKDEYDARMRRQLPSKQKIEKADYVLYNDGSLKNLKQSTQKVFSQITQTTK